MKKRLQNFVNSYFSKNPPILKFRKQKDCSARADIENNIIYIDFEKSAKGKGGYAIKELKKIKGMESVKYREHYIYLKETVIPSKKECLFWTLLHEIAHFKLKNKFKKIEREYSKLREKAALIFEKQHYGEWEDVIKQKKNESDDEWQGRIVDFEYFCISGNTLSEEIECDLWALKEFKRKREYINQIIKNSKE